MERFSIFSLVVPLTTGSVGLEAGAEASTTGNVPLRFNTPVGLTRLGSVLILEGCVWTGESVRVVVITPSLGQHRSRNHWT